MTRAGAGFDPYHKWLGIPPGRDTPTHYQLLGLQPGEADATVIEAAASRQTSFVARFRGGRYDAEAARVLFEIEQARYTLLDPDARRKYEAAVRAKAGRGGRSAGEPLPPRGDGRTVGEESGLAREFGGVMAVIVAGFLVTLAATFYFWDRGGKPTAVAATPAAAAAAEAEVAVAPVADAGPKPADLAIAPDAATPAPEESEPAWISLFDGGSLDGWQPTDFPGAGPVRLEDGACLLGRGENLTGVTWQREPPRGDYELRLEARRVAGGDFFCGLTFPVGGEHCTLIVGGWGGGVVGLSDVDGKDASQNETTRRRSFAMERWYKVRLTVEGRRVKAWIDDAQVVDLDATGKSLSVRREAEPSKPLGVTAWRTAAAVRNIEYRSLSDSATAPSTVKSEPVADVPETARANGVDLPAATDADSEHLFNAMDLTGWRLVVPPTVRDKPDIRDCWTVDAERKVLVGHGSKTYWTHWLETDERFGDFVLSLEWRFPPTGTIDSNGSGIVVRSSGLDRNERNPRGVEIDLRPAHGEEGRMATGGLIAYDVPASNRGGTATPEVRGLVREKPPGPTPAGGWNTCEITCRGDRLTVVINGERVNEGWGLERSPGAICLRSQKSDVEFRNVRIRRLDRGEPPASKASAATSSATSARASARERIGGRTFPSVFQAWAPADNLPGEDRLTTLTRHDLVWNVPQFFGLKWDRFPVGLAEGFTPHGIAEGQVLREQLLAKNPRMVLLAEIRYRDAPQDYLPDGHEWWLRDGSGQPVSGWKEGGHLRLDLRSPGFRRHVAAQCRAAVASGVVDGVMLDWWDDDEHRLALVKEVRRAVGEEALIIANANARMTPRTAPYLNGYFMECTRSRTPEDWKRIAATLTWAETHLREQRVNCVETWWHGSRRDESLMRATTALALTHSDGYCLFSDPNPLPASDHLHDWYPFWDANLGRPLGRGEKQPDGTVRRRFENGFAVYNPMGNGKKATVRFDRPHRSVATGETDDKHSLPSGDGDIYLPGAYSGGH